MTRERFQGVRYDELAPMLLNEVQQQKAQLREQGSEIRGHARGSRGTQADLTSPCKLPYRGCRAIA